MSTPSPSTESTIARLEQIDYVIDRFNETKKMLKKETKKLRDSRKKWDKYLDAMDQRIEAQSQQWTGVVVAMRDSPYMQELEELQKRMPKEEEMVKDRMKMEDLMKSMSSLGYKVKCTAELCEDGKTIQERAEKESKQLSNALKEMNVLEKKHKEMLKKWTVEESLGKEEAKALVMKGLVQLKKDGGNDLAKEIEKFMESIGATSGANEQLPGKPVSHTVYVPSSAGAGASTSGFHYKN